MTKPPPEYHLGEARKEIGRAAGAITEPELLERLKEAEAILQAVEGEVRGGGER